MRLEDAIVCKGCVQTHAPTHDLACTLVTPAQLASPRMHEIHRHSRPHTHAPTHMLTHISIVQAQAQGARPPKAPGGLGWENSLALTHTGVAWRRVRE